MGKKGAWFSSIKRLFTKQKHPLNENKGKDKRSKHGSIIPLFRKPSSIEEILGEFDQHNLHIGHHPTTQPLPLPLPQPQSESQPPQSQPPQPQSQLPQPQSQPPQPQPQSQPPQSKPQPQPPQSKPQPQPPQSKPQPQPHSKPQPQPASSSSSGRPVSPPPQRPPRITSPPRVVQEQPIISHRPEPTLQQRHLSATRIQAVYRGYKTRKNVGSLTGLVRLQRVVTSQNVKRQTVNAMKQMQQLVRVQTQIRSQRIQMLKNQPQPETNNPHKQGEVGDEYWDDSLITKEEREARLQRKQDAVIKRERAMAYAYSHQSRKQTAHQTSLMGGYPWWWNWIDRQQTTTPPVKNHQFAATPSRSTPPTTPMSSRSTNRLNKFSKARKGYPMKDDDSLMSCPPFSVPSYMSPTASARAKARPASNPREGCSTPGSESSKRRFSFPFTPNTAGSIGDLSMNSVPASLGRKPFNRFV